jgi:hypothetical protein
MMMTVRRWKWRLAEMDVRERHWDEEKIEEVSCDFLRFER